MRFTGNIFIIFLFFSCGQPQEKEEKTYDLYEYSEMALYMHSIYDIHQKLREDILSDENIGEFPDDFLNIHTAELSDFFERTASFDAFSKLYIQQIRLLYDTGSDEPLQKRFNNAINVCIACHQTTCLGPLPKIRKLLID